MVKAILCFLSLALAAGAQTVVVEGGDTQDFGAYPAKDKREAVFTLRNGSDVPLKILQVRKTCGCTVVTVDKELLAKGESATIKVVVSPFSLRGPFAKSVHVETNDPTRRFTRLTVKGDARPLLAVSPEERPFLGRVAPGALVRQRFAFNSSNPELELGAPVVKGGEAVLSKVGPGEYALDFHCLAGRLGEDVKATILVPALKPVGWKPLELSVMANVGDKLLVIPPVSRGGAKREVSLRLLGGPPEGPDPAKLTWKAPAGVTVHPGKTVDRRLPATLELAPGTKAGLVTFEYPGALGATLRLE